MGQTQATKEAIWLKNLLNQLLRPNDSDPMATVIFGDNQGAIVLRALAGLAIRQQGGLA